MLTIQEFTRRRDRLQIDADGVPRRLGEAMDDWQRQDMDALTLPLMKAMGIPDVLTDINRAYLERPRGHSKTSDSACLGVAALTFGKKNIRAIAAAGDQEQAALLRQAIARLVELNPWLDAKQTFNVNGQKVKGFLDVKSTWVTNVHTGSSLTIITSDAFSSYGMLNCDLLFIDEITHWRPAAEEFWISLFSAAAKRKNCLMICIANAGFGEGSSWQWKIREAARTSDNWYFSRLDGPQASWISAANLAEQKRLLPDLAYRRLWLNEWTSGSGDALTSSDIDLSVTLPGPLSAPEDGYVYVAALDVGVSHDHTGLAVVGIHVGGMVATNAEETADRPRSSAMKAAIELGFLRPRAADPDIPSMVHVPGTQRLKLALIRGWKPADGPGGKVDLLEVENTIREIHGRFQLAALLYDPSQAILMAQRLTRAGLPTREVPFTLSALADMANVMVDRFVSQAIDLYRDEELLAELRRLRIKETAYGLRLDADRTKDGHCDRATALALAVVGAKRFGRQRQSLALQGGELLLYPGPEDYRAAEDDAPPELWD